MEVIQEINSWNIFWAPRYELSSQRELKKKVEERERERERERDRSYITIII